MKIPFTMRDESWTPGIKFSARRLVKVGLRCRAAASTDQGGASVPASRLHATRTTVKGSFPMSPSENASVSNNDADYSTASPSPGGEGDLNSKLNTQHSKPCPRALAWVATPLRGKNSRQSYIGNRKSERGVALVITLILLSVTLVMAVAFLALSRRERGSVATETDTTTAKLAADAALAQAEAQIVSGFLATTNPYVTSLLVSTNFLSGYGYNNTVPPGINLTNVNYNYPNGTPVIGADLIQNVANLYYLPRPPVYATNYVYDDNELQFYLDLNRNGRYDTNGWVTNVDDSTPPIGLGTISWQVGDPEWIGVLEHPDAPHSANNPFVARYAFIAVPANSLDLNNIHNQALQALQANTQVPSGSGDDEYSRDQGVGPWEINLAAFLTDLNTNRWDPPTPWNALDEPYLYPAIPDLPDGKSVAFDDARALVAWRYGDFYPFLASANGTFLNNGFAFEVNGVDGYGIGSQTNFDANFAAYNLLNISATTPWLGAQNTNNFFSSPSELFDPAKSSIQFTNNLWLAGTYNSTYDRYTFYRLLGQLGTDTAPEADKLNLNYSNAVVNYDVNGLPISIGVVPGAETNLVPWVPINFFTAAADKLLHAYSTEWYQSYPSNYIQTYYGFPYEPYFTNLDLDGFGITNVSQGNQINQIPSFGITNIPVYLNGVFVYSSAVNRLLQLAANMYDASTNTVTAAQGSMNYPSVFRPVFWVTNEFNPSLNRIFTNVYIKGYQCIQSPYTSITLNPPIPPAFTTPIEVTGLPNGINVSNVWGVPMIIGAKKGLPNFNAFETANDFFIERELQFNRNTVDSSGRTYTTNQMYIMGISNYLGVECWNSYASNYNNQVEIAVQDELSVLMTVTNNSVGEVIPPFTGRQEPLPMVAITNMTSWSGYSKMLTGDPSFVLPLATNTTWLTNSEYYNGPGSVTVGGFSFPAPSFVPTYLDPSNFLDAGTGIGPMPQFGLIITNRLQAYILDTDPRHFGSYILDYVQLGGMNSSLNITNAIADPGNQGLWSMGLTSSGLPSGVNMQFLVSSGSQPVPAVDNDGGSWSQLPAGTTSPYGQAAFFSAFFSPSDTALDSQDGNILVSNYETTIQAPYTPSRHVVQKFVYDANDPLVHYLASDLYDQTSSTNGQRALDNPPLSKLGILSGRYMPWGNSLTDPNQMPTTYLFPGSIAGVTTDHGNHYNLAYKDPLVWSSDNWDFPTNKYPTVGWLGRVHRGTPWQSVYLKSTNILDWVLPSGIATWAVWTGDLNAYDAEDSAPVQDRVLFDLFTATPDSASTPGRLNVNIGADDPYNPLAGLASWSALLSGAITFSNNISNLRASVPYYQYPLPNETGVGYVPWTIQPAGPNTANSPLGFIVQGINSARTNHVAIDGLQGVFEHAGDVLSASELSDASPFLNWNNAAQQQNAISDEMYEWLPQQMLSLLTASGTPQSPQRYVIYCYGQTLKPAPDGLVTTGQFFGLCTNYQVEAESASRAIIRVENTPTPGNPNVTPHIIVEQYNPLPPD